MRCNPGETELVCWDVLYAVVVCSCQLFVVGGMCCLSEV